MELDKQPSKAVNDSAVTAEQSSGPDAAVQSLETALRAKIDIRKPYRFWILVILLGWSFDYLFWERSVGVNFTIFFTLALLVGTGLLIAEGHRPAGTSLLLLLPFLFFAVNAFLRQEPLTLF